MNRTLISMTTLATAASALALGVATPAYAQDAATEDDSGIQDIIVTAQRREESVQDVPIAISAFDADQLRAQGVNNTLQLGQFVPNLVAQNNTGLGSANAYFLRGLGNTETIATFDPPVGTYVNDIYISRQNANNLALFDVERVEVLRGPQGTLFGRNTTGGAINLILADPGDELGGYVELGYGRYNAFLGRASVDLPLAEGFSVKLSGYYQNDDGYVRNVTTGDRLNDNDGWGARLGIRGELGDSATWSFGYAHIVANGENILNFDCNPAAPTQCDGRFATTGLIEGGDLATSPYAPLIIRGRKANYGQGNRTTSDLITSNLTFELDDNTNLAFITGYIGLTQQFALDFFDGRGGPSITTPVPAVRAFPRGGFTILNDGLHTQFTQEVKINGEFGDGLINYVAGIYYLDERNRTDFADVFSIFTGAPGGLGLLLADRTLRNTTEAWAGYAQADVNLGPITLTAGIRYTDETKDFTIQDNRPVCIGATPLASCLSNANLISLSGLRIPTEQTATEWTPRFAINYRPNDDLLLFASATRGFKSGGWNARGTVNNQLLPFDPELVWSYELGLKSDWFDRRFRANITLFRMDVTGLQTPSALVNANGSLTFLTRNFADYRNQGVEAEFTFAPVDGLFLYANVGYQDDKYILPAGAPALDIYGIQSVAAQAAACRAALALGNVSGGAGTAACGAGIVDPQGNISEPVRTPDWSLALGGSYRADFGNGMTLTPSINATYRSEQETGTSNLSIYNQSITGTNGTFPANLNGNGAFITGSISPAAWLFNASLTLGMWEDRATLSVECTNCFNEQFVQSTLANYSYLNQPMQWMVRARYNF
jgi:iron complex outermembrane recepter protein